MLKLAWVSAWFPASLPKGCIALLQSQIKHRLEKLRQQIKAKARQFSPTQAMASLAIDPLQSLKSLGKYFPFKIALYGEGETCKQRLLILP